MPQIEWLSPWPRPEGAERAQKVFQAQFGSAPNGVWSAPGRVNLIGDHTDYAGGICLPMALPHRTYVALKRREDNEIHLFSEQINSSQIQGDPVWQADISEIKPGMGGWGAYVAGVAKVLIDAGYRPQEGALGFDAAIDSCVPLGASLSSSAALETAAAVALSEVWDLGLTKDATGLVTLKQMCQKAENDIAGVPCGGLDQSAALFADNGYAVKLDFKPGQDFKDLVALVPFDLEKAGLALLVIDSRAPHNLGDGQYSARRDDCIRAAHVLGVPTLRDIGLTDLPGAMDKLKPRDPLGTLRRRTRHVVTENARTTAFISLIRHGLGADGRPDLDAVSMAGALMDASHDSLRDDFEVTVPQTDLAVASARAAGAYGARMTGGGFGGSAIALVSIRDAKSIAESVRHGFQAVGFKPPAFLLAEPSAPAGKDL